VGIELGPMDGTGGVVTVFQGDTTIALRRVADGSTSSVGRFAVTFRVVAGETYRLQVTAITSTPGAPAAGRYEMRIIPGEPPTNDVFPGSEVREVPFRTSIDTTFATIDPGEASTSGSTVWFQWQAPGGTYVADTFGSAFPARLAVKDSTLLDVPGGSRGIPEICQGQARVVFDAAAGEQLWFQVGSAGFPGLTGELVFNLRQLAPGDRSPCGQPGDQPPFDGVGAREIHVTLHWRDLGEGGFVAREDSAGVVQLWFGNAQVLPPGRYSVSVNARGVCDFSDPAASGDAVAWLGAIEFEEPIPTRLTEHALTTRAFSLFPGRDNSIYDMDGTSLVFHTADFLEDPRGNVRACAVLAPPVPAPPVVGTGLAVDSPGTPQRAAISWIGLALATAAGGAFARRNHA
jgi:hypothetical protein